MVGTTLKKTVFISVMVHTLFFSAAFVTMKSVPLERKVIFVEIVSRAMEEKDEQESNRTVMRNEEKKVSLSSHQRVVRTVQQRTFAAQAQAENKEERRAESVSLVQSAHGDGGQGVGYEADDGSGRGTAGAGHFEGSGLTGTTPASPEAGPGSDGVIAQIRSRIERVLVYPELARKRRQEGTVVTQFTLSEKGMPENIRVVRSSGFDLLDASAKTTIQKASPFPAIKGNIEVPIRFRLEQRDGAAVP